MYVDYNFYSEAYGGKVPEEEFMPHLISAINTLNYYTFGRIVLLDVITVDIKYAVCELINHSHSLEDKQIESERVGTYSVSYSTPDSQPLSDEQKIVAKWLGHTGLMYRGVYE